MRAGEGRRWALTQQQDWHLLLGAKRTARALQNNLLQANGVRVSEQTVRNRLYKGMISSRGTCAHRPAPCSSIGRSTIGALFSSQMSSFTLYMWQAWKRLETSWWVLCCLLYHPVWPIWWWGSNCLGRHTLGGSHRPARHSQWTLTAVRYRDENLRAIVRPWLAIEMAPLLPWPKSN